MLIIKVLSKSVADIKKASRKITSSGLTKSRRWCKCTRPRRCRPSRPGCSGCRGSRQRTCTRTCTDPASGPESDLLIILWSYQSVTHTHNILIKEGLSCNKVASQLKTRGQLWHAQLCNERLAVWWY